MNKLKKNLYINIGVTGHRDVITDNIADIKIKVNDLFNQIASLYPNSPIRLFTSLAEGSDRIVTEAFLDFKRRNSPHSELIVILPMPEAMYVQDFKKTISQFNKIKKQANLVFSLPLRKNNTLNNISKNGRNRDLQYQDAAKYINDRSNILIAVWDSYDNKKPAGTSATVKSFLRSEKYDEFEDNLGNETNSNILIHIPAIRLNRAKKTNLRKIISENIFNIDNVSLAFNKCFYLNEIEKFNKDINQNGSLNSIKQSINYLLPFLKSLRLKDSLHLYGIYECLSIFSLADSLSIKYERQWMNLVNGLYLSGILMAFFLPLAIESMFLPFSMILYISFFMIAAFIYFYLNKYAIEDEHLTHRSLAEFSRVQFYWLFIESFNKKRSIYLNNIHIHTSVLKKLLTQQHIDLGWISNYLNGMVLVENISPKTINSRIRAKVLNYWIEDQLQYYKKSSALMTNKLDRFFIMSKFFIFAGLIAGFIVIFSFLFHFKLGSMHHILVVFSVSFPLFAIIIESYLDKLGLESQIKIKEKMYRLFKRAIDLIKNKNTSPEKESEIIFNLGHESLSENVNWLFIKRIKPLKIPT
jgi:hypothetical protein